MKMNDGSVTYNEVIEALKFLGGKARTKQIEEYIIAARGNILPKTYEYGGWDSYRKTIAQMIQFHCYREPKYIKYRGPAYFEYISRGNYKLTDYDLIDSYSSIENRQIELYSDAHKSKISETEFDTILEEQKELGIRGEQAVLQDEKDYLIKNGRADLANNIRHISKQSVSEGYDIISYDLDGNNKFIEVKTSTKYASNFYITDNELKSAEYLKHKYWIYRVIFTDKNNFEIIKIQNPSKKIEDNEWKLEALSYLVKII